MRPFNLGASNNVSGSETVSYNAVTHELTLTGTFLDNSTGQSYSISDSKTVDLYAKFGSTMYVGFTGGTGGTDADQRITSFSLTSAVPEPETYAMLLAGLGIGLAARRRKAKSAAQQKGPQGPFFTSDLRSGRCTAAWLRPGFCLSAQPMHRIWRGRRSRSCPDARR
jgi:hypothetical protein